MLLVLAHRTRLTTDGLTVYLDAVEEAFEADTVCAMLVKIYGLDPRKEKRYSPRNVLAQTVSTELANPAWPTTQRDV